MVECIANNEHLTPSETLNVLNKKSGLLGLSGVSSDMRDVRSAAAEGNEMAKVTLDIWAYRIRKYIGAYAAAMGGLDAIIFTAGIGENDGEGRAEVLEGLEFLGVKLDAEKNAKVRGVEAEISAPDSKVKIWVIPTNEELAIARDTADAHQQVSRLVLTPLARAYRAGGRAARPPSSPSLLTRAAHLPAPPPDTAGRCVLARRHYGRI